MNEHVELPSDPEQRRRLQSIIKDCVLVKEQVATIQAGLKDTISTTADDFNIPKKILNKLITTAHKCNFEQTQNENESFEFLYEALMRGGDRKPTSEEM